MKKLLPVAIILIGAVLAPLVGLFVFVQGAMPFVQAAAAKRTETAQAALPKKPWDFWTVEIETLSGELEAKLADLSNRENLVTAREDRVAASMAELRQARAEIDALRNELNKQIATIQEDEAKNIRTLAATYAEMKPRAALAIMRELSDDTIVKILSVWKPDNVRPLLDEISRSAATEPDLVRRAGVWSERLRLMPRAPVPANT